MHMKRVSISAGNSEADPESFHWDLLYEELL
jgi:hypothetical protein